MRNDPDSPPLSGTPATYVIRLIPVAALLLLWGCADHSKELEEILHREDRRSPAGEFTPFVTHPSHEVKRRAAIALGRLRDPEAVPLLVELLKSSSAAVRVEAAFSLGQLGEPYISRALLAHLAEEQDLEVRLTLIEALSKVAVDTTLDDVGAALAGLLDDDIPIVRAETALAIARLGHRGYRQTDWGARLAALLQDDGVEVRWRAAYALMRLADSSTARALRVALKDRSPRVRMQAARALGAIHDEQAVESLVAVAHEDGDWRVRVDATTAVGKIIAAEKGESLLERFPLQDANAHVRLAALRALGATCKRRRAQDPRFENPTAVDYLRQQLDQAKMDSTRVVTVQEQIAAAVSLGQVLGKQAIQYLAPIAESAAPRLRAGIARALGETGAREAFPILAKMAEDPTTLVRIAVLQSLPKTPAQRRALPIYLGVLTTGDAVLTAIAAQNLAADSLGRYEHAPAILAGYRKLARPIDVEAGQMIFAALAACGNPVAIPVLEEALSVPDKPFAQAAARALQKLTGKEYDEALPKETLPHSAFTFEEIKELEGARAQVETDIGEFELELLPEEAPLTVLNFVRLAKRGFFDGLDIHRVVPNFVIQTGDPRGDMWGSPGYSIRSEFSRLRYIRGTVGMASAGPDTEGCQWFITHSDQPHLDGRYTVFARVRRGMEIVDKLQVGNRLRRITIYY